MNYWLLIKIVFMIFRIVFFISFLSLLIGCKSKSNRQIDSKLPDSFLKFYEQFHTDSAFQMNHIDFPLSGVPSTFDNLDPTNFQWEENSWELHRPISNEEFKKKFSILDSTSITEYIYHPKQYGLERRFAKIGNEWYLIYCTGMHKIECS